MYLQKKIMPKWQTQQSLPSKHLRPYRHRPKINHKSESLGAIFGLPNTIIEEPRLDTLKMIAKSKSKSYRNYLQNGQTLLPNQGNALRNRLMTRTKQIFQPLKKHNSAFQTIRIQQNQLDGIKEIKNKKAPIASEHSSQKTLNILQKIIFKQVDFYAKEKPVIVVQASKLPIIENKESKRKQSLAAYQAKFIPSSASVIKYEVPQIKHPRCDIRKEMEKPYFSGWQVNEGNDF